MSGLDKDGELARFAFVTVLLAGDLALGVLAVLAIFRTFAAATWWMIGLCVWQVVLGFIVYWMFSKEAPRRFKTFVVRVIGASLLLVTLHSIWQAMADRSGAEEIGDHGRSELKLPYIFIAALRTFVVYDLTMRYVTKFLMQK